MNIILLLLSLLGAVANCVAHMSGAPVSACGSLTPEHPGNPQEGSSPYIVSAEKMEANKVKVTISSNSGETFKGFILQARSADNRDNLIVGEFKNDEQSQGISCGGHEKSALTHVNNNTKSGVTTEWTGAANEDVIFRATVVQSYTVYWVNIDSEPVTLSSTSSSPIVTVTEKVTEESVYRGCFESKGCLGIPNDCVNKSKCDVLFTYQGNKDDGSVQFVLHGLLKEQEYMAMGLSDDKEMGNDTVTGCLLVGSNVKLQKSWNVPDKYNTIPTDVTEPRVSNVKGLTTCRWKEPKIMSFNGKSYNFANDKIHILLALGPLKSDAISYHRTTLATTGPVNFFEHKGVDYTIRDVSADQKPSEEPPKEQPEKGDHHDSSNCCSQLKFGLFSFAFFAVFYAGGRNALNLA